MEEVMQRLVLLYNAAGYSVDFSVLLGEPTVHWRQANLYLAIEDVDQKGCVMLWTRPDRDGQWLSGVETEHAEKEVMRILESKEWTTA